MSQALIMKKLPSYSSEEFSDKAIQYLVPFS